MSKVVKTEAEWKKELSKEAFQVLRNKATERPRTGEYDKFYPGVGHFACAGCALPLYSYQAKFDSGCGWPAFDRCYKDALGYNAEADGRVEIVCGRCDGHLGHVFKGEQFTKTNERHCVNSVSIKYVPEDKEE